MWVFLMVFFNSFKEIDRLGKEINKLLSKVINRLLSKGMSNICLKVTKKN